MQLWKLTPVLATLCVKAGACETDLDCSLSGHCVVNKVMGKTAHAGQCVCKPGWSNGAAKACEILDVGQSMPVIQVNRHREESASNDKSWTWGGSPAFDNETKLYHLYFSFMTDGCGLLHYQTNSVVKHATAKHPLGPWDILRNPILAPRKHVANAWDSGAIHGPEIRWDPTSKRWLLFYMGTSYPHLSPNCSANPSSPVIMVSSTRCIGLAWSESLDPAREKWIRVGTGVRSAADEGRILTPRSHTYWDSSDVSNAAPYVFSNGSILLGYRAGGDGVSLAGGIGFVFADTWNSTTWERVGDGAAFAAEDGTLWHDGDAFHMLVHRFAAANGSTIGSQVGGHAFSLDGRSWSLSQQAAYNTTVHLQNSKIMTLYRRERPKVLLSSGAIQYLYNGAWPCHFGPENDDREDSKHNCESFTMATAVSTRSLSDDNALLSAKTSLVDISLFVGGIGGYFCYRLPNLVQLREPGHLLAFAEGHKHDCNDGGWVDVLVRRTTDNGKTWSPAHVVYSQSNATINVTIGNPSAVVDIPANKVFLFVCKDVTRLLLLTSADSGATWTRPRDLTSSLVPSTWTGIFTGLPQGIQLSSKNDKRGRLIICANHVTKSGGHSHTIFSDDHGVTWANGNSVDPNHMGECSLAQMSDGTVIMYARVWWDDNSNKSTRAIAYSTDGGESFTNGNTRAFPGNPGRDCQGSIVEATLSDGRERLLVGSPWGYDHFPRVNYTILASDVKQNRASTWAPMIGANPLWSGPSGYSSLLVPSTNNGTLFILYERGTVSSNEELRLTELVYEGD